MAKLTEGAYRGTSTGPQDVKFGVSANGNMQIGLVCEIREGEHAGRRAVYYGNVEGSDEAIDITARALRALGWDGVSWTELKGLGSRIAQLVFQLEEAADPAPGEERKEPRLKLAYINAEAEARFKNELSREDVAKRLAARGAPRTQAAGASRSSAAHNGAKRAPREPEVVPDFDGPTYDDV